MAIKMTTTKQLKSASPTKMKRYHFIIDKVQKFRQDRSRIIAYHLF